MSLKFKLSSGDSCCVDPNSLRQSSFRTLQPVCAQLKRHVDIGVSHDWPRGIARHGDLHGLLRAKSFLKNEVHSLSLSSGMVSSTVETNLPSAFVDRTSAGM